ncbi:protein translocase subunit SecD [Eubacterium sp. MSJ-33]|uniref:protein translocase subunit SecD n=1 Tax=Eubacterium sp. MSJ-33 TaxID=2841528 RepID=UPI001C78A2A6|nr:protein translocase subunit SecD [Eubacterium sp. MSJ-33]QWT52015.1 protein translocase subunit SecD [Eubacterium sp. MSJ-33]
MKKTKRKAVINLIIFFLLLAGGIYMAIAGVGKNESGKTANVPLGLDLQGGLSVTYEIQDEKPSSDEINATVDKLQRRVDAYSSEGEVYQEGNDRITVEIPLNTEKVDAHDVLDELGQPGQLLFLDSTNYTIWQSNQSNGTNDAYEAALTGSDIKNAQAGVDDSGTVKDYVVQLQFTDEGAQKFAAVTSANIGKPIYIIYDGAVASAPTVQAAITDGNAVINKISSYEEAENLASTIKIGALPLELKQIQYNIVGAKLGQRAVSTSLIAGAIGFALVCVLMIVLYRFPGFIASLALTGYVVLMLLILSIRHITLTLPGIAGIILSIGMAVDANVIIFTRIREEISAGNGVRAAVKAGFSKALSAILDGNITTLIATVVLMALGSGSIKGFAVTLMLGIVLSMFTALFVTKMLLNSFLELGVQNPKMYGKAKEPKIHGYVKNFKICGIASLIVIVAGLAFLGVNHSRIGKSLNYSLEFTGGTSTTATFAEDNVYTLERAESEVAPAIAEAVGIDAGTIQIQTVEGTNQVIFKTAELTEEQSAKVDDLLKSQFAATEVDNQSISSTISGEMKKDAIVAIAVSSVLMLLYIAFRFSDVKFGVSAVLALVHDVLVVFAAYSIGTLSVGNTFIACMLTIVGYSINATIIIFDRIRENMRTQDSKESLEDLVNKSIGQTFTRTIYTSLTTFIMVFVLFVMGVASLKEFTFTLMLGIVCGAYSSVCITGPLWYTMKKKFAKKNA